MKRFIIGVLLCLTAAVAPAATLGVGYLVIEDYRKTETETRGGANFIVRYKLSDKFKDQSCCKEDNLRWLQLVRFDPASMGFPEGDFIDPQPGQNIGGGNKGDDLPFYDITGSLDDLLGKGTFQRGKGKYLGDGPFANWTVGDIDFLALTLLVCVLDPADKKKEMIILGGLSWGFSNDSKAKKTTLKEKQYLADSKEVRKRFNDALDAQAKFKDWNIVEQDRKCGPACVTFVPEPASGWMVFGALLVLRRSRRWVWRS
jgi:hypothetical protein